jgi:hypothetical protein
MKFTLCRDDLIIEIYDVKFYKKDIEMGAPINGTIHISIESHKYSAKSYLDLDYKKFVQFFDDLAKLWSSLEKGEVILQEPYGYNQFVRFYGENGKFEVTGKLVDVDFQNYSIEFREVIDQSYMNGFINQITKFDFNSFIE